MPELHLPSKLKDICNTIYPLDPLAGAEAQKHLDGLTKPLGSLGRLEEIACRLYAIQGERPLHTKPARMYTIAGDHGVVQDGVASTPQNVSRLMVENFLSGGAGINCLCEVAGADLRVVDAGVLGPEFPPSPMLISAKIGQGTASIARGPAMTAEECEEALLLGVQLAHDAHEEGFTVLGTGEMGIGNTTPSSALFCAFLGLSPAEMTGMGAGVPAKGLEHKQKIIQQALAVNAEAVASQNPFTILAALGGFEIAALAGMILGAASRRMAVVVDGFISTAAFVAAERLCPAAKDYCFFSHGSAEAGHGKVLEALGEKPLLDLGLRLGEGTGAAMGFILLDCAAKIFNDMSSLSDRGISLR